MNSQEAKFPMIFERNYPLIKLPEKLTVLEAVIFKRNCHQLVNQKPTPSQIIIDFSQTQFIDSSGVGALIHNLKYARERKVELIIQDIQPPVMAVFSLTGLDTVLKINSKLQSQKNFIKSISEHQIPETHPSVRSPIKRLIDIIGSLVGLGITAVILLPIAIAIKLDSPGPIFFVQIRCGWMGKRFKIWKFRSMLSNAEALKSQVKNQASGAFFKNDNDPRITRVGRFLRRTSLDEFPQFWNVLTGDMSLVGTRPPTPEEVERYEVPEWQRLNVKPGMTGEWQVNGRSQVREFEDVIRLDLRYQHHWSLKHDLQLIVKTLLILFNRNSGAV